MVKPNPNGRTSNHTARNRAMPQPFPQTMTDPLSLASAISAMSAPSKQAEQDTTWHRARDDMRPLPTPDKNRHVYSEADCHAISAGGVTDHVTKMPTHPADGNRY